MASSESSNSNSGVTTGQPNLHKQDLSKLVSYNYIDKHMLKML